MLVCVWFTRKLLLPDFTSKSHFLVPCTLHFSITHDSSSATSEIFFCESSLHCSPRHFLLNTDTDTHTHTETLAVEREEKDWNSLDSKSENLRALRYCVSDHHLSKATKFKSTANGKVYRCINHLISWVIRQAIWFIEYISSLVDSHVHFKGRKITIDHPNYIVHQRVRPRSFTHFSSCKLRAAKSNLRTKRASWLLTATEERPICRQIA